PSTCLSNDRPYLSPYPHRLLPQGFGPETVAVAVAALAGETDVAAEGDFFFDAAQVRAQPFVGRNPHPALFEVAAPATRPLFLERCGKGDRLDFATELAFGFVGYLHAEAAGVDAAAPQLGHAQQAVELETDLGESFVGEFDAHAVPDDVADFFAEIQDAEVFF